MTPLPGQNLYYALGAIASVLALFGAAWKATRSSKWVQSLRSKIKLVEERDRAVAAAEISKEYARIATEATTEYKNLAEALRERIEAGEEEADKLKTDLAGVSAQVATLGIKLDSLWNRLRLALKYILTQSQYIRAVVDLLNVHAPNVPIPVEPSPPAELGADLKALESDHLP